MYTALYGLATIICFMALFMEQPINRRSVFDQNTLVLLLFSLIYLLTPLVSVYGSSDYLGRTFDSGDVEDVSLYCLVFVLTFTAVSLGLKSKRRFHSPSNSFLNINYSDRFCFIGWLTTFFANKLFLVYYGVYDSDYTDSYFFQQSLPLVIAQVLKVLVGVNYVFGYLLIASVFDSPSGKLRWQFISVVAIILFADMWLTNSRSNFITFVIVLLCAYVFYGRSFGLIIELIGICLAIPLFGLFGARRSLTAGSELNLDLTNYLLPGEFVNVYSNAIHLMSISDTVASPGNSYLQAIISFVPSQLNPNKWDPASWYMGEYFPYDAEAGGGLAFGIIPEAIINWGFISIIFQACVVAVTLELAYSYARYTRHKIAIVFFLFSCGSIYNLVRNSSFSIIAGLIYGVILPSLVLVAVGRLLSIRPSKEYLIPKAVV